MLNKIVKVKIGIIVLFVLSISLLFSCIVKDDKVELKENKVVEKNITKPSNIQAIHTKLFLQHQDGIQQKEEQHQAKLQ